jgi:hypothetical protein
MTVFAAPNSVIEASLQANNTGGAGTYRISIIDTPSGLVFLPATAVGINERPELSGIYHWTGQGPARRGTYSIIWDTGNDSSVLAVEELVVSGTAPAPTAPPSAPPLKPSSPLYRLLVERATVLRYTEIGSEDGTPIQSLNEIQVNVPCRIDLRGTHRDAFFRTKLDAAFLESAVCILPPETNARAGDRLKITKGPRAGLHYHLSACEIVLGFGNAHHIEAEATRIEGVS